MIAKLVQLSFLLIVLSFLLFTPSKALAFGGIDSNGLYCSGPDSSCGDPPGSGICDSTNYWTCVGVEEITNNPCTLRQSCGVVPTGNYCGVNGVIGGIDPKCGNNPVSCTSSGAFATCSVSRSNGCMDCATPARYDCPTPGGPCVSDGGSGTGQYGTVAECQSAAACQATPPPTPTPPPPTPTPTPTPPPAPGCFNCPDYVDNWSCPIAGQTKLCHFVSDVGPCPPNSGAWTMGSCQGSCGSCTGTGGPPPTPTPTPQGTPPPPCTCLGPGAGCGNAGNCGCCAGTSCNNTQCRPITTPPPWCDFPDLGAPKQITPGYDQNGIPTSIPNWDPVNSPPAWRQRMVDFRFNWSDINKQGFACSGSGRIFTINVGVCEDGVTVYDPARCTASPYYTEATPNSQLWQNPNTYSFVETPTPGSARFSIPDGQPNFWFINGWVPHQACWNGAGTNCAPNQLPPPINGKKSSTYWYQLRADCVCDNSFDPQFSPTYIFTYDYQISPPAAPILICQASGSGDLSDICDLATLGSPLGYGTAGATGRHDLSARDGGPPGPRQANYTHRYYITDVTPGFTRRALPVAIGPNNYPGSDIFSLDTRTISNPGAPGGVGLENGHTYQWQVVTTDNGASPPSPPDSPPSLTWTFLYDTTPPDVSINDPNICFDTAGQSLPATIPVLTSDPGTPNLASNVQTVVAVVRNQSVAGSPIVYNQDITSTCSWNPPGNPGAGAGTCNLPTTWATPSASGNIYEITITSTDKAGNANTAKNKLVYRNVCTGPWLQSTQGDVHSNTNVNTPGGPN